MNFTELVNWEWNGRPYDAVGIGRAFTDVIGTVPPDLLVKYGIPANGGAFFSSAVIQEILGQMKGPLEVTQGGSVANTIAGLAAMGFKTGYFVKVGDDTFGHKYIEDLKNRNISLLGTNPIVEGGASATCLALLTKGGAERSFALDLGSADDFNAPFSQSFDIRKAKFLVVAAQSLFADEARQNILDFMWSAQCAGTKVVLSLSNVSSWHDHAKAAKRAINSTDVLVGNKEELAAARQLYSSTKHDEWKFPCPIVVSTKGEKGVSVFARLDAPKGKPQKDEYSMEAPQLTRLISTVGAGDQFLAGFLKGLIEGRTVEEATAIAQHYAERIIAQISARPELKSPPSGFVRIFGEKATKAVTELTTAVTKAVSTPGIFVNGVRTRWHTSGDTKSFEETTPKAEAPAPIADPSKEGTQNSGQITEVTFGTKPNKAMTDEVQNILTSVGPGLNSLTVGDIGHLEGYSTSLIGSPGLPPPGDDFIFEEYRPQGLGSAPPNFYQTERGPPTQPAGTKMRSQKLRLPKPSDKIN